VRSPRLPACLVSDVRKHFAVILVSHHAFAAARGLAAAWYAPTRGSNAGADMVPQCSTVTNLVFAVTPRSPTTVDPAAERWYGWKRSRYLHQAQGHPKHFFRGRIDVTDVRFDAPSELRPANATQAPVGDGRQAAGNLGNAAATSGRSQDGRRRDDPLSQSPLPSRPHQPSDPLVELYVGGPLDYGFSHCHDGKRSGREGS